MACDYKNFSCALSGQGSYAPTLFEPFLIRTLTEQLIWRRGDSVWRTPEARIGTLISLRERTLADVIALDLRSDSPAAVEELLACAARLIPQGCALVTLTDDEAADEMCTASDSVCAVASWRLPRRSDKLFIRMAGSLDDAMAEGADGYFAAEDAEELLMLAEGRITVLGGIGDDWLNRAGPARIHARCGELMRHQRYILGSGGEVREYLGLISMLGAYGKRRR